MSKQMKPMLASPAGEIRYPVYASPKLDGIRAVIKDGEVLSRTLKRIPNAFVQRELTPCKLEYYQGTESYLSGPLDGLDGELTVGPANAQNVMQATTSGVMSRDGTPDFTFWVFDYWTDTQTPYREKIITMQRAFRDPNSPMLSHPRVKLLPQTLIANEAELNAYEAAQLEQCYEGVMIRSLHGTYKYGRSTAKEGTLLKVKRFVDSEATVIGFEELMHNENEATTDELGRTKRSTHAAGKVPAGTLGALIVRDTEGREFNIGSGFAAAERAHIWEVRDSYIGAIVTYKHFAAAGVKDAPRFPVFKAFRNSIDIGEPK